MPAAWYLQNDQKTDLAELVPEYSFNYNFEIRSSDKITFVGAPADAVTSETPTGFNIKMEKTSKIPKREIKIFYKTTNMFAPQLKYQFNPETNEYACLASFVPTFEPAQP